MYGIVIMVSVKLLCLHYDNDDDDNARNSGLWFKVLHIKVAK